MLDVRAKCCACVKEIASADTGPKAARDAGQDEQEAAAGWLGAVQKPVKDVMSGMQQMASAAVQINEQKDSKHSDLWESMTPDALLACGKRHDCSHYVTCLQAFLCLVTWRCMACGHKAAYTMI